MLAGVLYLLAFPPFHMAPLAWVALVPLVVGVRSVRSARRAFLCGALAALMMCVVGFGWIADMAHRFWNVPWPVAALLLVCYASFGEINFTLFAGLLWWMRRRLARWPAAATAALFTAIELAIPKIFPDALGYTQVDVPALPAAAALVGTRGLSFVLAWFAACLAWLPVQQTQGWRRRRAELLLCVGCVAALAIYGAQRRRAVEALPSARSLRVVIVQANIGDAGELLDELGSVAVVGDTVVSRYVALTRAALADGAADLVVWPETAVPVPPHGAAFEPARALVGALGAPLVFGGFDYQQLPGGRWRVFNTMYWMNATGRVRDRYYKHKLLLLGEYLPFSERFPKLLEWIPRAGEFSPGPGARLFQVDGVAYTPLICYELLFPAYVRRGVRLGGQVLLNLTNDYWFGRYAEPEQHLVLARMRAFETGRPILRATNTGISAVIDANARVLSRAPLWQPQVLRATLAVPPVHSTPYLRAGNWLVGALAVCAWGLVTLLWKLVP